jgi:iron complex transport system ATP-binding protein
MNRINKGYTGDILIDDVNIREMSKKEISMKVGFVPAGTQDIFTMTVIDTVLIGRHNIQGWRTTHKDLDVVRRALEMLSLEDLAMRNFNELSAGQHQRVALARGIVQETPCLILDEPTSNLDVKHQVFVAELLRALAVMDNKLVIMICHDLNIAARYSHEIVVMKEPGIIYKVGKPIDVITPDLVKDVYGINCDVTIVDGSPHVILKETVDDDE